MKKTFTWSAAVVCFAALSPVSADIFVEKFTQPGTGKVASGYVLQGSRNMKHLGKGRTLSGVTVPALKTLSPDAVSPVIPALRNQESDLKTPKPRFGFGSDYQPDGAVVSPPQAPQNAPEFSFAPIYQAPRIYAYRNSFAPFPYFYFPGSTAPCYSLSPYPYGVSNPYAGIYFNGGRFAFSFRSPAIRYFGFP